MRPKVSICVPNLNTFPFLQERFDTILNQTFKDWELVVYDNFSEDDSWKFFQAAADRDSRIRIAQAPREGMYANWNNCVRAAQGEYVYIATSDDTMPPDCLEKLVAALETHPECGLAHCNLRVITEKGEAGEDWWPQNSAFARSSGELLNRPHIRQAPFDGVLHLLGEPVYISITQLLIRRSLFDRIGLFESRWGSVGDFNWNMRAGLVANTVHVPQTWGGWRVHSGQATSNASIGSADHVRKVEEMIQHAVTNSEKILPGRLRKSLVSKWAPRGKKLRRFFRDVQERADGFERKAFIASRFLIGSRAARGYVKSRLPGERRWPAAAPELLLRWMHEAGLEEVLRPF